MFVKTESIVLEETELENKSLLLSEKKKEDDYFKQIKKTKWLALSLTIIIFAVWTVALIFTKNLTGNNLGNLTFWELFYSINTLFTGLALAGVAFTLLLQRIELKHNSFELAAQKLQYQNQNRILNLQKFESFFFQLLSFHNKLHDSVQYYSEGRSLVGAKAFEEMRIDLRRLSTRPLENSYINTDNVFPNTKGLRNYFNNLYNIIKFLHEDHASEKDKYISIFKSQLSASEQVLLFYDCLESEISQKYKPLLEEYSMFENLDCGLLLSYNHTKYYNIRAFGSTPPPR